MSLSKPAAKSPDALALVIRYSRGRIRSTRETEAFLASHGVSQAAAANAIRQARSRGLIDDRISAYLWASHWARQCWPTAVIRNRLEEKGFEAGAIESAACRIDNEHSEQERAVRYCAQRSKKGAAKNSLARSLTARGFDLDLIETLLNAKNAKP